MKRDSICVILVVFLLVGGCAVEKRYVKRGFDFTDVQRVAVIEIQGQLRSEAAKRQIADFFAMELLNKGYAPVERVQVESVLEEQKLQSPDLGAEQLSQQTTMVLNVPTVFIVNVPYFGEDISIAAKLVAVKDGEILWMNTVSSKVETAVEAVSAAASYEDAGLSAQIAGRIREMIAMMCQTLPPKSAIK